MHLPRHIYTHPLLKHPKLQNEAVRYFQLFFETIDTTLMMRSPRKILATLIDSPLYAYIVDMLSNQRSRLKNGEINEEKKEEATERIVKKARLLLQLSEHYKEIDRFVNAMVLGGGELTEGEGVNLLTVHASKGLEFDEVYVVDLVDGRFPNTKMMSSIEEERRLFYVAVTRAKDALYLSFARYDKAKKVDYKPSQFLIEAKMIPHDFV